MPNITVTIPAEHYRQARIYCAQHRTSISGLFRVFIENMPRFHPAKMGARGYQIRPSCEQCAVDAAKALLPVLRCLAGAPQPAPRLSPSATSAAPASTTPSAQPQPIPAAVPESSSTATHADRLTATQTSHIEKPKTSRCAKPRTTSAARSKTVR